MHHAKCWIQFNNKTVDMVMVEAASYIENVVCFLRNVNGNFQYNE